MTRITRKITATRIRITSVIKTRSTTTMMRIKRIIKMVLITKDELYK